MIYPTRQAAIDAAKTYNKFRDRYSSEPREAQLTGDGWTVGIAGTGRSVLDRAK